MTEKKELSSNLLTTISSFFEKANTRLKKNWDRMIEIPKNPVDRMLKDQRRDIVFYIAGFVFFLLLALTGNNFFYISRFFAFQYFILTIDEVGYLRAIKLGKEDRIAYDSHRGKPTKRVNILAITLVILAIIVTQNVGNLGTAIETALPWSKDAAEAILKFTNGMVEELVTLFEHFF